MAGSYPDMPSRKMAWDSDGTVVFGNWVSDGGAGMPRGGFPTGAGVVEMTQNNKELVNGATDAQYGGLTGPGNFPVILWALLFPEKREVDGYYWNHESTDTSDIEYLSISKDSTNVRDGTYTALGSEVMRFNITTVPDYRNNITSSAESNVTSIYSQWGNNTGIANRWSYLESLHVYGSNTPGQNIDQLIYLDTPSDFEFSKPLDYGDIGQGSASIRKVKVKNNSLTKTATAVTVEANAIVGTSDDMWTYSTDGVNDAVTESLGNLGPGGTQEVYIHHAISDSYTVGLYEPRTELTATSWA